MKGKHSRFAVICHGFVWFPWALHSCTQEPWSLLFINNDGRELSEEQTLCHITFSGCGLPTSQRRQFLTFWELWGNQGNHWALWLDLGFKTFHHNLSPGCGNTIYTKILELCRHNSSQYVFLVHTPAGCSTDHRRAVKGALQIVTNCL